MDPLQFCYWLQGFAEINGQAPTDSQWRAICSHLNVALNNKKYDNIKPVVYRDATTWPKIVNQTPKEEPDAYL